MNILALGFDSARPIEYMKYLPDSAALRQHTLSDGPYRITSYSPGKGFTLERNPVWEQATDTLRHAYVDKVVINEDLTAESTQEQLEAGVGDLDWNVQPPTEDLPGLEGSPNLVIGPPSGYLAARLLVLNQYAGPFTNKLVREAARVRGRQKRHRADRRRTDDRHSGRLSPSCPAARAIFPGTTRTRTTTAVGDPAKARALLRQAGYPHGVAVKLVYSTTEPMPRAGTVAPGQFRAAGFHVVFVPVTQAEFFGGYLQNPSTAKRDVWDMAAPRWFPDWFGNNGRATLQASLHRPRQRLLRLRGLLEPGNRLPHQPGHWRRPASAAGAGLWSQAERQILGRRRYCPRGLPEVAHLPFLRGPRLQFLVGRRQLRPHQRVALVVTTPSG